MDSGLVDDGNYPNLNAVGVADFYLLPAGRARFVLFDWCRIDGIYVKKVCGTVTRFVTDLEAEQRDFWRRIHGAKLPLVEH